MRKFLFLLSWVAVTIAMTGCSTYYGYESSQGTEDVNKSDKILEKQVKSHSLDINGKRLKLTANYNEKHEKQVKHYEVREYIYLKRERKSSVITGTFGIIRGVLLDLLFCSGDWHLASNPPNIFRRILYVPPISWFFPLVVPPYYEDPEKFHEGKNTKKGLPIVYKTIEREECNESIKNTVYNIETSSVIKQGNIEIEIAGKTTVLNLAAPVIKVNMLPIKPLPPKSISARSKYKKTSCDFKINTLEILDSQSQMAWKNFQLKNDVNSLLFLLKHKLIGDKDFNDLLFEKTEKLTVADMITLKKSSNLAPRVLRQLNQKLEKIARLKASKKAKIKKYKYPYADKYPFALKLTDKWSSGASQEWFLRDSNVDTYNNDKKSIYIKEISTNPKIVLYSNIPKLKNNKDKIFIFGVPSVEDIETTLKGYRDSKSKDQPILIGTSTRKGIPIEETLKSLERKYGTFAKITNKVSYLLMGSKCQVNANTFSWLYKSDKMYIIVNSNNISNTTVTDLTDADLLEAWGKIMEVNESIYGKYSSSFTNCKRTFNSKDRVAIARLINERKFGKLEKNALSLVGIRKKIEPSAWSYFSGTSIGLSGVNIVLTDNLIQVIKLDYKMFKDFSNALRSDINKYRKAEELKEKKKEENILNNL